ncbi:MAG TPA: biotin carboxylase N-terminal domain-containing protein [Kofleriaceae bacterium]|nr:biotin carboxylase N-terminal domain-containing protein [Kofleriaceae bacterium]
MRTLRELGIASVAVYHVTDRHAPHVALADERIELRHAVPVSAYLDAGQLLAACTATGADALHPGYGFLSESAGFAEACARAGVVFIGPSPEAMRLVGDKLSARALAARVGAPVSPAVTIEDDGRSAAALGFPLLIKAAAGGGGKGMRIVRGPGELAAQVALARSEAERYFGDPRVYAEPLIERPRHLEVQVLGDGRGGAIALGTRDCSIQRRHQKLIEEAPAQGVPAGLVDAALAIARAARYGNAGTVEFVVAPDGRYQFLEVNARLQVEHPVTERVTGWDLVAAQLAIAAGEPLPAPPAIHGCAIECRICAEEPEHAFRPATGRIGVLRLPAGDGVRVDSGVREGQEVTAAYDSLLLKLVVHGASRPEALERMQRALAELVVLGVATNADYLARLIASAPFQRGDVHTQLIAEHPLPAAPPPPALGAAVEIAAALADPEVRRAAFAIPEPYASIGGFRN